MVNRNRNSRLIKNQIHEKAETSPSLRYWEESHISKSIIDPSKIWADFQYIPTPNPITNHGTYGDGYVYTNTVDIIEKVHISPMIPESGNEYTFYVDSIVDIISDAIDSTYQIELWRKDDMGDYTIPISTGLNNWSFDYTSGVLRFLDNVLPTNVDASNPPAITCYKYIGSKGLVGMDGTPGNNGSDGQGLNWLGSWSSVTAYVSYDLVEYNGSTYICISNTTNEAPDSNPTKWNLFANKGDTGADGPPLTGEEPCGTGSVSAAGVNKSVSPTSGKCTWLLWAITTIIDSDQITSLDPIRYTADSTVNGEFDVNVKVLFSPLVQTTANLTGTSQKASLFLLKNGQKYCELDRKVLSFGPSGICLTPETGTLQGSNIISLDDTDYLEIQLEITNTYLAAITVTLTESWFSIHKISCAQGYGTVGEQGPPGNDGADGTDGQGLTWDGTWNSGTAYIPYDLVEYNGSTYICISNTTNEAPDSNPTKWELIAQKGVDGTDGIDGTDGQGIIWQGNWNSSSTYSPYDMVKYNGSGYICIVSTTNEAPDSNPTKWNLTVDKGDPGNDGSDGQGLNWLGTWNSATAYIPYDLVKYNGSTYICIASTTNEAPDSNPTKWTLFADKGDAGATGSAGADGSDGQGLKWLGTWNSATAYIPYDITEYLGSGYICILNTTNDAPDSNPTKWELIVQKGDTGATGSAGADGVDGQGLNWLGTWSSVTAYIPYDVIFYNGSGYICISNTTNEAPDSNPTKWELIVQKGDTGSTGSAGADGTDGQGLTWLGTWNSGTSYIPYDLVEYNGSTYICISNTTNEAPDSNPTKWELIADKGNDGVNGTDGQGLTWLGTWSSVTAYIPYDLVEYDGSAYICIASTTNDIPDSSPTKWDLVVQGNTASGTVTSIGISVPSEFSVSGSPITSSGTISISKANQNANLIYAGPTSGGAAAPTFRSLVSNDLPTGIITTAKIADANVSLTKIVPGSLTNQVIVWNGSAWQNGFVDTGTLVDNSVTAAKINDAEITNAKLVNNTITNTKIAVGVRQLVVTLINSMWDLYGSNTPVQFLEVFGSTSLTEFGNSFSVFYTRQKLDLTYYTQVRIVANVQFNGGNASSKIVLQYSVDSGSSWHFFDSSGSNSGPSITLASATLLSSTWITMDVAAQTDVWIRLANVDGSSNNVGLWSITAQFK